MQIKTILISIILLLTLGFSSCASTAPGGYNPSSVAEAEEQLAQKKKEQLKASDKAIKAGEKRYWKMQSKEARKRVKRTNIRQKRNSKARNR